MNTMEKQFLTCGVFKRQFPNNIRAALARRAFSATLLIGLPVLASLQLLGAIVVPSGYVAEVYSPNVPAGKDLGFDSRGTLYVAQDGTTAALYKIAPGGTNVGRFGSSLSDADSLAVDADDNVYRGSEDSGLYVVAPNGSSRLVTSTYMGNIFSLCIDRRGLFGSPGDVFVGNARSTYDIVRVKPAGQTSAFVTDSVLYTFAAMAFDDVGFLYAAESFDGSSSGKVCKISPTGAVTYFASLSNPYAITFSARERLFYVSDLTMNRMYRLQLDGTLSIFAEQVQAHGLTIGPDGWLYLTEWTTTPNRVIRIRQANEVRQITSRSGGGPCASCCGIDHRHPLLSPDGARFVFSSIWNVDDYVGNLNPERNRELFLYDIAQNKFQQLTVTTNGMSLPYSFQGDKIGFVACSPQLSGATGTNAQVFGCDWATHDVTRWIETVDPAPVQLGTNCPYAWFAGADWTNLGNLHLDLAKDQRHIAWASTRNIPSAGAPAGNNADGNYEIFWKDLVSGEVRQITTTLGGDNVSAAAGANLWPRISADGSRVAFVSNRDFGGPLISSNRYGLFLADTNGSIQRLTTAELVVAREFPAFGMDTTGLRVVFASDADLVGANTNHTRQIFAFDLSTSNLTQITHTGSGVTNCRPILSGDGLRAAFFSNGNLTGEYSNSVEQLWLYNFDPASTRSGPFIQVTSLASSQTATEGRMSWVDWHSLDYTGSNLVFTSNADLVGSNTNHAYEVFLASFDLQPYRCDIALVGTNQYQLSWPAAGSGLYTVESCTSPVNGGWSAVAPTNQWPILRRNWTNTFNSAEAVRFFRVKVN
jgi:Tol biopolymer transport system component